MFLRKWGANMTEKATAWDAIDISQKNREKLCKIVDMMSHDERLHLAIATIYHEMVINNANEMQFKSTTAKELITIHREPMEE